MQLQPQDDAIAKAFLAAQRCTYREFGLVFDPADLQLSDSSAQLEDCVLGPESPDAPANKLYA